MASMLEQLMELPLFRGVSHTRMAQTVGDASVGERLAALKAGAATTAMLFAPLVARVGG